jgi:glucose-6-phosphate isomerase
LAGYSIEKLLQWCKRFLFNNNDNIQTISGILLANMLQLEMFSTIKIGFIEMLVNYHPRLHYFTEWWKQLFGESEGKEGKGIFPTGANFTTDLHSLGQYIQDGKRNLFEQYLKVENPQIKIF